MPLLVAEADKLSQADKQRGVIEEIIDRDDLFALLPFTRSNDKVFSYVRESTLSEGDFLDPYDAFNEGAATFDEVTSRLKVLGGDVDMDKFTTTVQSALNDQIAIQIASKAKGLGRKFRRALINGSVNVDAKSFDGVRALTVSDQTLIAGANGAAVTLSMIDELKDTVKLGADVLMMRRGTWRAIRGLLRALGGNVAETIMVKNFGHPIPAIDGTPVILNDFIEPTEVQGSSNVTTSIYAMRLNEADGFHGLYGGPNAGIVLEDIGTVQNKDANRWRVKWYCGTALRSTLSLARLKGVTNV